MIEEFTVEYKAQREWGWLAMLDFFLAGSGAGLYVIGMALRVDYAPPIGLVAAAVGALALLADLGRPDRFWRAIARPNTSWISRGAILVTLFLAFGILTVVLSRTAASSVQLVSGIIAAVAAIGVMAYTGFLLADSRGVPAWRSALVPVQFVVFSLLAGCGGLYLLAFAVGGVVPLDAIELMGLVLGFGSLLMLTAYLMALGSLSPAARRARQELVRGSLSLIFLGGGVILGVIVPTAIVAYLFFAGGLQATSDPLLALAGALLLVGGLLIRYALLKAGFYQPVVERM